MSARRLAGTARIALLAGVSLLSAILLPTREAPAAAAPIIPSPESVLGFVPGEDRRLADWAQVIEYLNALGAASGRVRVEEIGKTTLGRPFVLVTLSSEANQARIEEIRRDNNRLADPRDLADHEAEALVTRGRVVVAMGFSIRGSEVGGTLTALRLLHRLATYDDPETRRLLEAIVLLLVPSQNPDGVDLVASWYRKQLATPYEGTMPPVLCHPYEGPDLDRDGSAFTQQETRLGLLHVHQRWHPQIVYDLRQMGVSGARLSLPPYGESWEPNVDAALVTAVNALGAHVVSELTGSGRTGIVTGALRDAGAFAPAYPHTHGGVRLLSETASARLASPINLRPEDLRGRGFDPRLPSGRFPLPWPGGRWAIADVVDAQLAASLAVLGHAARWREEWLRGALGVNRRAASCRSPFAFVLPAEQREPAALARLLAVLRMGEVEVGRARAPFVAAGRTYEAGTYVVSMQQPASAFGKAILERRALPLLLGVEVEAVEASFVADLEPLTPADAFAEPLVLPGRIEGRGPRFVLGHTTADLAAVARLLAAGVRVRWALEPFEDAGRSFAAGALLVPAAARDRLEPLTRELGIVARAVRARPRALGLARPRVGLYASWVPAADEGWTRFVFEQEAFLPYQTLHDREIQGGRLADRFDAIVLPDQSPQALAEGHPAGSMPAEYVGGLGAAGASALRAFVEAGGTLVALNSAARYAISALRLPLRDVSGSLGAEAFFSPGSILEVRVDPATPLGHGLPDRVPVWFEDSPVFEGEGVVVARYEARDPLSSGRLIGAGHLAGRGALVEIPLGDGRVVLFGFRPQYRAQARVSYPALLNALYLSAARR